MNEPLSLNKPKPQGQIPKPTAPEGNGDFVQVACKLSNGLILELITPTPDALPGTFRTQPMPVGKRVVLAGSNSLRKSQGIIRASQFQHDYAVTPVPREFWEEWLKRNQDFEFVKNGQVFALDKVADIRAAITERREDSTLKTGVEPLHPVKDDRLPKSRNPNETITGDQEQFGRLMTGT